MQRKLASILAIPAAVALTFSLTSCGDDSSSSDTTSESKSTATSGSSEKKKDDAKAAGGTINGAGASSQKVAVQAWIAGYTKNNKGAKVNYDPVGSGGGRTKFLSKAADFAGSDAYLKEEDLGKAKERCGSEVIELPMYISPIAVAYNLDGVEGLQLSPATIAKIFNQKITNWNDAAIKADNPNVELPDLKITPVNRSDKSGTTQNFTHYLSKTAKDAWPHKPSGNWPVDGGESSKGTSGVVSSIKDTKGAIGYADASQVEKLGKAKIKVGSEFVELSSAAAAKVIDASDKVEGRGDLDFAIDIKRDTTEAGTYPLVLVSYTIACTKYEKAETADMVKSWIKYVASEEAQKAAAQLAGSAPISEETRKNAMKAADAISSK